TLLLPATGFGEYDWGRTVDEPAQAIAKSPWAVRNQIPLGSEGNTRMMDTVDAALADGRGDPGLAGLLARSGYRFLLLRNDIDRSRDPSTTPITTFRAGLASSPGIAKATQSGPLELYEVKRPAPLASATSTNDVPTVRRAPEKLLPFMT